MARHVGIGATETVPCYALTMRLLPLVPVAALALSLMGCANRNRTDVAKVVDKPVAYDEAMTARNWPRTEAAYLGGGVEAGPSYFSNEYVGNPDSTRPERSRNAARFIDGFVFLGNAALLPVRMFQTPPWSTQTSRASFVPPSYHAAPPLPEAERETVTVYLPATRPTAVEPASAVEPVVDVQPMTRPEIRPTTRVVIPVPK